MKDKINDEELEILISAYQDGSSDAAELLISSYEGYFQKFLNVLKYRFNISDHTERGFLRYFVKSDEAREHFHLYKKSDYIRRVAYATVSDLKEQCRSFEDDELKNEMVILFLTMAGKHNFEAPFRYYISNFFPPNLYKLVKKMIQAERECDSLYYDEDDIRVAHYDQYDLESSPRYLILPMDATDFDENWVNGYECGEMFMNLTIYERRMLKWYYEWKALEKENLPIDVYKDRKKELRKTEEEIAFMLGCSRKTVNVKRNDIKRKINKLAKERNLLKDSQSLSHL